MVMMIVVVIYMLAMIMLNVDNGADDIDHADIVLTDGGGDVRRQHYLVNFDAGELER